MREWVWIKAARPFRIDKWESAKVNWYPRRDNENVTKVVRGKRARRTQNLRGLQGWHVEQTKNRRSTRSRGKYDVARHCICFARLLGHTAAIRCYRLWRFDKENKIKSVFINHPGKSPHLIQINRMLLISFLSRTSKAIFVHGFQVSKTFSTMPPNRSKRSASEDSTSDSGPDDVSLCSMAVWSKEYIYY